MPKKNVILAYKSGLGILQINRVFYLRFEKKKLNQIRKILLEKINKPEYKSNQIPWWHWLAIMVSLILIVTGIVAFSLYPYNYVLLVAGMVGFVVFSIVFCLRFGKKRRFVEAGLASINLHFGEEIEIYRVFEKPSTPKKKGLLKAIVLKIKKDTIESDRDRVNEHDDSEELITQSSVKIKTKTESPEKRPNLANESLEPKGAHQWPDQAAEFGADENQISSKSNKIDLGSEQNKLRMNESEFSEVVPEDGNEDGDYELRDSIELAAIDEPQNFYDPSLLKDVEIEKYSNGPRDEAFFTSNNPYGIQPVLGANASNFDDQSR